MLRKLVLGITALLFLSSCDDELKSGASGNYNQIEFLANVVDNHVLPEYRSLNKSLEVLVSAKNTFVASKTFENLQALRTNFTDAYKKFQPVIKHEYGLAADTGYYFQMNNFPFDKTDFETSVIENKTINLESILTQDLQGFPAVDYILNGLGATDSEIIEAYKGANGDYYSTYLGHLIDRMQSLTGTILTDWENGYANTVKGDGEFGTVVINSYIESFEKKIRKKKVDDPSGKFSGVSNDAIIESLYNPTLSRELLLDALATTQLFFEGINEDAYSLKTALVEAQQDGLIAQIKLAFLEADQAVNDLDENLQLQVQNDNTSFLNARDKIQQIVFRLKGELVSFLGVPVTFIDNDGD